MFKVVQIYLKKDKSQPVCIYFFYFVTGGCEKLIFGAGVDEKVRDHEKGNKARGLQKIIGVRRWDQEKVRLYNNCLIANNLCIKKALHVAVNGINCCR